MFVEAGLISSLASVLIITLEPGHLLQDVDVSDVLRTSATRWRFACRTLLVNSVVGLEIQNDDIRRPLKSDLLE